MNYLITIKSACLIFPIIALLMIFPYIIYHYHKYGSITFLRTIILYSFVLYLLVSYFLVILPLPTFEEVSTLKTPTYQIIPFNFVKEIVENSHHYQNIFMMPTFYQTIYNLLLTLPFGIYMHYYFQNDFKKTVIFTFLLSLFFELTQLTGLYFIYPRSYRLFDIDDLIINTIGGILGYSLTKLFTFFLPTRNEIELNSYIQGTKISFFRKFLSSVFDLIISIILALILKNMISLNIQITVIVVLLGTNVLIPFITKGYTIGKKIMAIKLVSIDSSPCKWYQYLIRYFILYFSIFLFLYVANFIELHLTGLYLTIYLLIVFQIFIFVIIYTLIKYNKHELFLYEKLSQTKNVSSIIIPEELKK